MKPIIVINLKTYQQGKKAIDIAKKIEKVDKEIILGVQASDVYEIAKKTKLKVYAQHVDYFLPGRNTGYILPEAVKKDGGVGTFLNHSEHKLNFEVLKKTIARCKKIKLKTLVFANNLKEAEKIQSLKPDYLAIEPPELVGGKKSVSTEKPELISSIKKKIKMKFLVGAGIHTREDVKLAMKLGASGVAFSSVITKAKNPEKKLREMIK
ncbi:MAG TPA: triose-phosphate isomerase [Candidatus Pacearchaeota archaeon]|nr:triose-phosphate isomerase [Candidatus Pacearchaeota archaeon]